VVPRYTSYPSANLCKAQSDAFGRQTLARAGTRPVSLYVHVPFCEKLCFYCGCNMQVTHRQEPVERYLEAIDLELQQVAALLPKPTEVVQLHLGGGTPTFLDDAQLRRLIGSVQRAFPFQHGLEASLEVHPPVTTHAQLQTLVELGFNRLSMGVQDFDPEVQERVNRPQPFAQTAALIAAARAKGFSSINVDLMYGLPLQTAARFRRTLDLVETLRPNRIALFGYAHMPSLKKHQRMISASELPGPSERLEILDLTIERLLATGYRYIGLDHFALEGDELTVARDAGTLRRNFMGYTTCAQSDVLAFGPSSISEVDGGFLQNERELNDWARRLESGQLPVVRGWDSSRDDALRAELIQQLFCRLELDTQAFGAEHGLDFEATFAAELTQLAALEADGLVERRGPRITVTPVGQLLLRNVAAVFDAWLPKAGPRLHSTAV
jgi:oxygen-independent coproporphyrinogen III oxidase